MEGRSGCPSTVHPTESGDGSTRSQHGVSKQQCSRLHSHRCGQTVCVGCHSDDGDSSSCQGCSGCGSRQHGKARPLVIGNSGSTCPPSCCTHHSCAARCRSQSQICRGTSSSGRSLPERLLRASVHLIAAAGVLLLMLLPFLLLPAPRGAAADLTRLIGNLTYPLDEQLSYCRTLGPLYDGIPYDLRHWNASYGSSGSSGSGRISRKALELAIECCTTAGSQKGVALGFYGGTAFVLQPPNMAGLGHHVNILFTYMLVMLDLQRQYGREIPDMEFVIASSDRPLVLTAAQDPDLVPPVMRFCSSDEHADIKIPIFHFYTKKYTQAYLANAEMLAATYPWSQRLPVVFGRFSKYYRHIHPAANSTHRLGEGGRAICRQDTPLTLTCPVRAHFMEWAAQRHPDLLDVRSGPRVSLAKHAAYKYLIHLDGQALSSRLEQLLPLRSLVLKEESGYKAFYYHLLRPYEHYVPVWKAGGGPEDVVEAHRWAQEHDQEAERMAAAAQQVALRYLSKRARSCFWLRLFQAYASLQSFTPNQKLWPESLTVEEYLETVGRSFEGGRQLHRIEY